uniref:JmjC domain-containing protein n=1 Tax=viral metagenome TaxID=1070528 RepID=A0A6C0C3X1_9ZZZZ
MYEYFLGIIIFCIVLFLYLHIIYHLKTSSDLEIYTIESPSKDKLEEICNLRQPVIFDMYNTQLIDNCSLTSLDDKYNAFEISIRDINNTDQKTEQFVPLLLKESIELFKNDNEKKYITEKNEDFLEETCVVKILRYNDYFLRPPFVAKCMYDFLSGSIDSHTPLRYNLNYRNYYYVTSGKIKIKLIPPQYSKYLYETHDYDNFEFSSPLNLWNIQDKYKGNYDKIKVLDVELNEGTIIFIPSYWWFTIQYEELSSICSFKYRTYMNFLAISPRLIQSVLQNQNIKLQTFNKVENNTELENNKNK